eukprot:169501-Rhodomonas_salina.1
MQPQPWYTRTGAIFLRARYGKPGTNACVRWYQGVGCASVVLRQQLSDHVRTCAFSGASRRLVGPYARATRCPVLTYAIVGTGLCDIRY